MRNEMDGLCNKITPSLLTKRAKVLIAFFMLFSIIIAAILIINFSFIKYGWINVHLIPHTHDDVGWLRTPEDYYENYVKYILSHSIRELYRNPTRKFVFVETYFFWQWWQEQPDQMKELVRCLIRNKQFEIVGGGWVMSDEAVTHYQSFIDQSTWGFRLLNDTFGPMTCPTVAWQIDTFGHSEGIASLLAQMGFSSLFVARIDFNDRQRRKDNKQMEFVWMGNKNLGESSSIFTSVFYDHYSAPTGFDFEMQPMQSNINFDGFASYVRRVAKYYRTDNILVPMGDDFRFFNARKYFQKLDSLVSFFRDNPAFKLQVFYSTPSLYIKHLMDADLTWPEKRGDLFPYASEPHAYWTGFFTSRPSLKYFERVANNFLQICKQLMVFSNKGMKFFNELTSLREAVGVIQHHDAITGTAQQHVTNHYVKLMYKGLENCQRPVDEALGHLSSPQTGIPRATYTSCLRLNISECEVTEESSRFVVTVYNPLSRKVDHYVRVPVKGDYYSVRTADGMQLTTQIVAIPKSVANIPGRMSTAKAELLFKATDVPAMGFKSFYVSLCEPEPIRRARTFSNIFPRKTSKLIFDKKRLRGMRTKKDNISLTQTFKYYQSTPHLSGAYLFKPVNNIQYPIQDELCTKLLSNGELVLEYEQTFSSWLSQIIRVYRDEEFVEFEWLVGPIPMNDGGKEVTVHYTSDIKSGKVFYTDVNGMEMQKREKDLYSWRDKTYEKVAGNYYPVTTMISVKDDARQIYVIIDRPQGGTSLRSGEIELMLHRRTCYDDGKGVDEPLNETAFGVGLVVRGRHWVMHGRPGLELDQNAKLFSQMKHSEPWLFFSDASSLEFDQWRSLYITEFSGLYTYVPRNIRVLTLEPWREDSVLLRLQHIFERLPERRLANAPVRINLQEMFKNFCIVEARETTLGADRWLSESERLKWRRHTYKYRTNKEAERLEDENFDEIALVLNPFDGIGDKYCEWARLHSETDAGEVTASACGENTFDRKSLFFQRNGTLEGGGFTQSAKVYLCRFPNVEPIKIYNSFSETRFT